MCRCVRLPLLCAARAYVSSHALPLPPPQDERIGSMEARMMAKIEELPIFIDKDVLSLDLDQLAGTPFFPFASPDGVLGSGGSGTAGDGTTTVPPPVPGANLGAHLRSTSLRLLSRSFWNLPASAAVAPPAVALSAAPAPSTQAAPEATIQPPAPLRVTRVGTSGGTPKVKAEKRVRSGASMDGVMLDWGTPSHTESPAAGGERAKRHQAAAVTPRGAGMDGFEALQLLLSQVPNPTA